MLSLKNSMKNITMRSLVWIIMLCFYAMSSAANSKGSVTGLSIPRYVSLKFSETNLRKGPHSSYPISWAFKQKGYPMEVVDEFENWRKVRDQDGNEGWVHENLISGSRSIVIANNNYDKLNESYAKLNRELVLFRYPDEASYPMLRAEIGVIAKLKSCERVWCKLKLDNESVWARKENLWGVYPDELIK